MARIMHDPATSNHATALATLGAEYTRLNNTYRYVQFKEVDVVAVTIGSPLMWVDTSMTQVTTDVSASAAGGAGRCCGIALRTMTDDHFGYMQTKGLCTNITTDGNVEDSHELIIGGDDVVDVCTPGTSTITAFGYALADDVSTTLSAAVLDCG